MCGWNNSSQVCLLTKRGSSDSNGDSLASYYSSGHGNTIAVDPAGQPAPAARRRPTVRANKPVSPEKGRPHVSLVSRGQLFPQFQPWLVRPGAGARARARPRPPPAGAQTLPQTPGTPFEALLLRLPGVDVVSVFHKLLSLHVKSRRRFLVLPDMNYGWSLQCTLRWLLMYPHL